jgi:hypothetical protein
MVDPDSSDLEKSLQRQVDDLQAQVEELREQVTNTGDRVREDLSKTSTLPVDTFDACDPMVEAALADSAVQIFMRHMTAIRPDMAGGTHEDVDDMPQREQVSQDEIDECLEAIAAADKVGIPDLLAGLDDERMWILADLSHFGTGLTRHRATKELREFLTDVWKDAVQIETLKDLVQALHISTEKGGASALLRALLLAASTSLERQGHTIEAGDSSS